MTDNKRNNEYEEFLKLFEKEHSEQQNYTSQKPSPYRSYKRKAAKKRRQRRRKIISITAVVVMFIAVMLIVKSRGGDMLKGTWDFDGVTVYQFDGKGKGSLNLPGNTYPFTYGIKDKEVSIDFESDAARDVTYTFSVNKEKLILVSIEENREKNYELMKKVNK